MSSAEILVYTTEWCPYCTRAKALLSRKNVAFTEVNVEGRSDLRSWLQSATGQGTVPQVFINNKSIGGYTDMAALDGQGKLDGLLMTPRPAGLPALPR